MATLSAKIPNSLYKQVEELTKREDLPPDQFVAIALSAQVSAWMAKEYLEERAKRGSWEKFQKIRVPVQATVRTLRNLSRRVVPDKRYSRTKASGR